MLTPKLYKLLMVINDGIRENGYPPSYDEMRMVVDQKSKSGIHRMIKSLEERGFVRRMPYRARALEVIRLPAAAVPGPPPPPSQAHSVTNIISGKFPRADAQHSTKTSKPVALPLYGRIAAGTPIEALRDYSNTVEVPASLLTNGDFYALEIAGDSMIEAGIFDGDIAIIQRCDAADNGSIVVALIEDTEVTLKRLRKRGHSVALEPANRVYETRIFGPDQVKIQGRLVALIRRY